jgi:hypothetical protein
LAKQALEIWSYFGQDNSSPTDLQKVTGSTPVSLNILGQKFHVESWRDVLEQTLNTVAELEPEKFEVIANNFPRILGKDKNKFRAIRQLKNGYFVEVNLSAQSIQKMCLQAMETIELTSEDWNVEQTNYSESYKMPVIPQDIPQADTQKTRTLSVFSEDANKIEITLKPSSKDYRLIPLPRKYRNFFPGYKIEFIFESDIGQITTHVTAGPEEAKLGDPDAGAYITAGLRPWYEQHKELREGDKLVIEVIEPMKKYKLTIAR